MAATNISKPSAPLIVSFNEPASSAPVDANPDHPFFGQGGSYRFDLATGKTTLIERAGESAEPPTPDQTPATPSSTPAQE